MSCFSCVKDGVIENGYLVKSMTEKLDLICSTFAEVRYPCVINKDGEILYSATENVIPAMDLTLTIASLKSSAARFSSVLALTGCTQLKIMGEVYNFMMFSLDANHILAFYCLIETIGPGLRTKEDTLKAIVSAMKLDLPPVI